MALTLSGLTLTGGLSMGKQPPVGPTDPYYNDVSVLLHMSGANNGTTFTDNSPRVKTVSAVGSAVTSTAQYKFEPSALYVNGDNNYVSSAYNVDFNLQPGDFTVEFWYRPAVNPAFGSPKTLISYGAAGAPSYRVVHYATVLEGRLFFSSSNFREVTGGITISANTWYHVALVRTTAGGAKLYINGIGSNVNTGSFNGSTSGTLTIGANIDGSSGMNGYIDDVRITKGVARYTANFTPPTEPFPNQ